MIRRCPVRFDAPRFAKLDPKLGRELATAVRCYRVGNSEGADHRLRVCVDDWDSSGPACKAVYDRELPLVPGGFWQGTDDVHVEMGEATFGYCKFPNGWHRISMDFGALTRDAFARPAR